MRGGVWYNFFRLEKWRGNLKIRYSKDSIKFLERQPKKIVERIRESIKKLTHTPPEGDIAQMKGYNRW